MRDGEVVGTKMATGHSLLVDCRFELPFGKSELYFDIHIYNTKGLYIIMKLFHFGRQSLRYIDIIRVLWLH